MNKNSQIQFSDNDSIRRFQQERFVEEVHYMAQYSPFYRRMFEQNQIDPKTIRTIEDLHRLSVTTKSDLQLHNRDFIAAPISEIIDYVTTSGTLGDPVTFALTDSDLNRLAYNEALSFAAAGCSSDDILQLMTTIDKLFMAGLAYFLGARELKCGVVRVGNGIPELQWDTISRIHPSDCIVVPSFLIKLILFAKKQ